MQVKYSISQFLHLISPSVVVFSLSTHNSVHMGEEIDVQVEARAKRRLKNTERKAYTAKRN